MVSAGGIPRVRRVAAAGLLGVYAGIDDPRVRTVLILYSATATGGRLKPGDDAIEARYFPLARLPRPLAFASHQQAIAEYRAGLDPRA